MDGFLFFKGKGKHTWSSTLQYALQETNLTGICSINFIVNWINKTKLYLKFERHRGHIQAFLKDQRPSENLTRSLDSTMTNMAWSLNFSRWVGLNRQSFTVPTFIEI